MESVRRAVIDVGTNSIKLLVADVAGRNVQPVHEESRQTRLGRGFYETRRLQSEPIAYSANAVADFARTAHQHGTRSIRVIATSAARDAVNPEDLISAIESASGLKVEIISGGQEARWAFQGVTTDMELANAPLLLLDVGGGSTQFILGRGERTHFAHSFQFGSVRLLEKFPHSNPPTRGEFTACRDWLKNFLQTEVRPKLEPALRRETDSPSAGIQLVGTGGTSSILARIEAKLDRYDRERLEATRLSLEQVKAHRKRLWSLPLTERKEITGLPKLRADVILTGVLIYEVVMEEFGFNRLRVSTRGLRFAAVMD
ncbi:MAG: Ppx/GppA phosphatase family protein [Verrucomicrobiota bacterium]|jgi:exopolyphosphatase/guanosine-5'-triphosphate,3'-diphosphate pyrophosphatase